MIFFPDLSFYATWWLQSQSVLVACGPVVLKCIVDAVVRCLVVRCMGFALSLCTLRLRSAVVAATEVNLYVFRLTISPVLCRKLETLG